MIDTTRRLAEINSGSFHVAGIQNVNKALHALFSPLSDRCDEMPLDKINQIEEDGSTSQFATTNTLRFSARDDAPVQILCTGHSDTVFPVDSEFQHTWIEGEHLRGPGVADMKGGLVVLSEALRAIDNSPFKAMIGFTVLVSPDEEIGSPSSAKILRELAPHANAGLTYEPALADGTLAGARKGSGNFTLVARGKSVHAGRDFFSGRNAMTAIARAAVLLEALSDESAGISVNIGKISGGGPVNVVPDLALCRFNVRIRESEQQETIESAVQRIVSEVKSLTACELELHGNFNRPPKPLTRKQEQLFALLQTCGQQLDLDIAFKPTGGCCEGNNLAAAGLANIDTLGVRGGAIHSDQEFACLDSFVERAKLSALLMAQLGKQTLAF